MPDKILTPVQRVARQWGANLRKAREESPHATQVQFAKATGHSQASISRYERGDGTWTPEVMLGFAVALGKTVPELFPWPFGIEDMERFRIETAA